MAEANLSVGASRPQLDGQSEGPVHRGSSSSASDLLYDYANSHVLVDCTAQTCQRGCHGQSPDKFQQLLEAVDQDTFEPSERMEFQRSTIQFIPIPKRTITLQVASSSQLVYRKKASSRAEMSIRNNSSSACA